MQASEIRSKISADQERFNKAKLESLMAIELRKNEIQDSIVEKGSLTDNEIEILRAELIWLDKLKQELEVR